MMIRRLMLPLLVLACCGAGPWERHVVDDQFKGADGVRLADVNGDGRLDVTTGFEGSGVVRVYLNPGTDKAKGKWPAVTAGKAPSVEDAVFVDLDRDGGMDVVTCTEGKSRSVFVHLGPRGVDYLKSEKWKTEAIPALQGKQQWMFCVAMDVDGRNGLDLVIGSKGEGASIGWLECPADARVLGDWKWHPLRSAGWVMSLVAADMDGDGDQDVLASDRKGEGRGVFWLENPGVGDVTGKWKEHSIGAMETGEVMFLQRGDLDRDGLEDVVVAVKPRVLLWMRRADKSGREWQSHEIRFPEVAGRAKGVAIADVDMDGRNDLVLTCESAEGDRLGAMCMAYGKTPIDGEWQAHDISGARGTKYDLIEMIDLDGDGDLDLLTTEETDIDGVIWYENPTRR